MGAAHHEHSSSSRAVTVDDSEYRVAWRYEMRREAQLIVSNLYLGPFQASTNAESMRALGITHILCVRDPKERGIVFPRFPDQFIYMTLELSDTEGQNLISHIPNCVRFIQAAIKEGGTVLVYDIRPAATAEKKSAGISPAAAIVAAYIMYVRDLDGEDAIDFVQRRRNCIAPTSFKNQLNEYRPIVEAMKLFQQQSGGAHRRGSQVKRPLEDNDE